MTQADSDPIVTLIPGDGIGPEVVRAARHVLESAGARIEWDVQEAGAVAAEREGSVLPDRVIDSIRSNRVALKGPLATSAKLAYGSPNVALRERLGLHTTIRPCRALPGVPTPQPETDVVVIKMNQEDLYARLGFARGSPATRKAQALLEDGADRLAADAALSLRPLSAPAAERVVEAAFAYARATGRRRVTAVHKAQLIPHTDGLFLEVARDVASRHPDVELDDALIDTVCERLVTRPAAYDVLVMPRMYGDIVSGVAAALIGGPGLAPGINLGSGCALFEAAHGTAPRLEGTGRANPLALVLTGALLLRHLGQDDAADRVDRAVAAVVRDRRTLTYDLRPAGEPVGTDAIAGAVVEALGLPAT